MSQHMSPSQSNGTSQREAFFLEGDRLRQVLGLKDTEPVTQTHSALQQVFELCNARFSFAMQPLLSDKVGRSKTVTTSAT